jgi:hypothetical protein
MDNWSTMQIYVAVCNLAFTLVFYYTPPSILLNHKYKDWYDYAAAALSLVTSLRFFM